MTVFLEVSLHHENIPCVIYIITWREVSFMLYILLLNFTF